MTDRPPQPVLQLQHVFKSYRTGPIELPVLTGLDLSVSTGEWVAIAGASGSGKTTLLNIFGLLDHPDSGPYLLAGTDTIELDETSGRDILNIISDLHEDGRTIVMITHALDVAARSDRQLLLRDGRVQHLDAQPQQFVSAQT